MKNHAMNVVQKILSKHLVEGNPATDSEIGIRIDQTLTQDATGTMAYLQFESMGVKHVKNDLAVSYVDHNTVQIGFENADDHDFLASIAKKYGIMTVLDASLLQDNLYFIKTREEAMKDMPIHASPPRYAIHSCSTVPPTSLHWHSPKEVMHGTKSASSIRST